MWMVRSWSEGYKIIQVKAIIPHHERWYHWQGAFYDAFDDSGCSSAAHCTRVPKKNTGNKGSDDLRDEPKTKVEPEN